MGSFLKPSAPLTFICRNVGKIRYRWYDEGIKYPGFTYYPKNADFEDPPHEATKLFRVQRIKTLKHRPFWEKTIIKELKLDGKLSDVAIVKNIPENNARLWKVKHLIQITPITFPNGFPKDPSSTYLKENGELVVTPILKPQENRLIATEKFMNNVKKLDGETLKKDTRTKWVNGWQSPF